MRNIPFDAFVSMGAENVQLKCPLKDRDDMLIILVFCLARKLGFYVDIYLRQIHIYIFYDFISTFRYIPTYLVHQFFVFCSLSSYDIS